MERSTPAGGPAGLMNTASNAPAKAASALRQRRRRFITVPFHARAIGLVTVCAALRGGRH